MRLLAVKDAEFLHADNEDPHRTCAPSKDSDQTEHLRTLIRLFNGRILKSQGCKPSSFVKPTR